MSLRGVSLYVIVGCFFHPLFFYPNIWWGLSPPKSPPPAYALDIDGRTGRERRRNSPTTLRARAAPISAETGLPATWAPAGRRFERPRLARSTLRNDRARFPSHAAGMNSCPARREEDPPPGRIHFTRPRLAGLGRRFGVALIKDSRRN